MNHAGNFAALRRAEHSSTGLATALRQLDTAVKWITEVPAAALLCMEIGVLLANVVYRYVLHDPLTWGDELASLLFIWLSMLGAVIALRRDEHMRLTTLVARMAPNRRDFFEALGGA